MALNCLTDCDVPDVLQAYGERCTPLRDLYGIAYVLLFKCSTTFTDILDAAEWTTKKGALEIGVMPLGDLEIGEASQTTFKSNGEGGTEIATVIYPFTFRTPDVAADGEDSIYWQSIFENFKNYTIAFKERSNKFILPKVWSDAITAAPSGPATVSGQNPGFEFSLVGIPQPIKGDGDMVNWQVKGEINIREVLHRRLLPGVEAVI